MKTRFLGLRRKFVPCLLLLFALCVWLMTIVRNSQLITSILIPVVLNGVRTYHTYKVDCQAIYDMDPMEVGKSLAIRRNLWPQESDISLITLTSDCPAFIRLRGYDGMCPSEVEKGFPLAYSIVVHKYAWMVERLLRAVYSPNNVYCIHYDRKSSYNFILAMEGLARCLPNVFIVSKQELVHYASISRLKADLNCLSDLQRSEVKWKYVINLCGQDFPLRTNMELVSELKSLNGSNMLETTRPTEFKKERFTFHHEQRSNFDYQVPVKTKLKKSPPPRGIVMFTGNAYFVLSRQFVDYIHQSDAVRDFLVWSEDTYSPDEHFWATLVRMPGVPGGVPRSAPDITDLMSKTRLVKWEYHEDSLYPRCSGTHIRSVCIYGAAELRWLLGYGHWFANKFSTNIDPIVIQCLEEKLEEKRKELQSVTNNCRALNSSEKGLAQI